MLKSMMRSLAGTAIILSLVGCSAVVEPVALPGMQPDDTQQEEFEIKLQALTFAAAKTLNATRYDRLVSKPGNAFSADVVSEATLRKTSFPPNSQNLPYKLGVGDEVTLIQYVDTSPTIGSIVNGLDLSEDNASSQNLSTATLSNIISTTGRIGTDGSLLLIGVGRLDALGRQISELRDEVRSILIRNGKAPNFQLEITGFNSQKAYITTDGGSNNSSSIIPITDQGTTLRELIATAGIAFNERLLTIVRIQRAGTTYTFGLADLLAASAPKVYLKDQDHVFAQNLRYQSGKVFLLGGVTPQIIPILPEERQTLAEALFAKSGPLATSTAQRSAVYLLRGQDPVQAYHLDAQNPIRVLVADEVELRPNDIVFVAEQPISTFNRTLASITPLRILLRDIKNDDLP